MFLRLYQFNYKDKQNHIEQAKVYINRAKEKAAKYTDTNECCAFLCGNAGIHAVSAVIAHHLNDEETKKSDLQAFKSAFEPIMNIASDEFFVGRTGYLAGIYWLNKQLQENIIDEKKIIELCTKIITNGKTYSEERPCPIPLMYAYHETEYLGAAHGLSTILHMLLQSPLFNPKGESTVNMDLSDIKSSVDQFIGLQESDGNFPSSYEGKREERKIQWCHGAAGSVYLMAQAYQVYKDERYLAAAKKTVDLIWEKGLLLKGPGICHGVAGNGYTFLLLHRLTGDEKYLYRAYKFMEFLTDETFIKDSRKPDRPYSLYEGFAGTVCYLVDLYQPQEAGFPFMDVF